MFFLLKWIAFIDALYVPFMCAFGRATGVVSIAKDSPCVPIVETFMASVYGTGLLWRFLVSDVNLRAGEEYLDYKGIAMQQLCSYTFWTDLLSLLGNFWWMGEGHLHLMALRMMRLWRLQSGSARSRDLAAGDTEPTWHQALEVVCAVWMMDHFFACSWFVAVTWEFDSIEELDVLNQGYFPSEVSMIYLQTLRDGAAMLVGWTGPTPASPDGVFTMAERWFYVFSAPWAAMYMAWIFARLMVLTDRIEYEHTKHEKKMDDIGNVLHSLGVPSGLSRRVKQYHAFLETHNMDKLSYEGLFHSLSASLHVDLKLCMFENLVTTAPFFQEAPVEVVRHMVTAFEEDVFSPGDMVVKKGDVGNEMFFVMKGVCEVLIDDNATHVVAVKSVGEYFGEIALVFENQVRTAWIRAKTFTVCAKLVRPAFEATLAKFPEVRQMMMDHITAAAGGAPKEARATTSTNGDVVPWLPISACSEDADAFNGISLSSRPRLSNRQTCSRNSESGGGAGGEVDDLRKDIKDLERRQRRMQDKLFHINDILGQLHSGLGLSLYNKQSPASPTEVPLIQV